MTSPATNEQPPRPGTLVFHTLLEDAFKQLATVEKTAGHALRNGVSPKEIVDYVNGQVTDYERSATQEMLAREPWAMGRVVALVKARRNPASLGARILVGALIPAAYGIPTTEDPEADLAELLDQV